MASTSAPEAGSPLERPCLFHRHGVRNALLPVFGLLEHDPECSTCQARAVLAQHDHLHLGFDEAPCTTPGIGGQPGEAVRCSCGAYHH